MTLWDKLQVDAIDDGARQLVKDVAALNKDIKEKGTVLCMHPDPFNILYSLPLTSALGCCP